MNISFILKTSFYCVSAMHLPYENIFDCFTEKMNRNIFEEKDPLKKEPKNVLLVFEINKSITRISQFDDKILSLIEKCLYYLDGNEFLFSGFKPFDHVSSEFFDNFKYVMINKLNHTLESTRDIYNFEDEFFFYTQTRRLINKVDIDTKKFILNCDNNIIFIDNYINDKGDLGIIFRKLFKVFFDLKNTDLSYVIISLKTKQTDDFKNLIYIIQNFFMNDFYAFLMSKAINNIFLMQNEDIYQLLPEILFGLNGINNINYLMKKINLDGKFYSIQGIIKKQIAYYRSIYFELNIFELIELPFVFVNFLNQITCDIAYYEAKVLIIKDFNVEIQIYAIKVFQESLKKFTIFLCSYKNQINILYTYSYKIAFVKKIHEKIDRTYDEKNDNTYDEKIDETYVIIEFNYKRPQKSNVFINFFDYTFFIENINRCLSRKSYNFEFLSLDGDLILNIKHLIHYQSKRFKYLITPIKLSNLQKSIENFIKNIKFPLFDIQKITFLTYFYNKNFYLTNKFQENYEIDNFNFIENVKTLDENNQKYYDRIYFNISFKKGDVVLY
ncbi:hypothetical protein GVAV_000230 [Gurleya vavrai]